MLDVIYIVFGKYAEKLIFEPKLPNFHTPNTSILNKDA